MFKSATLVLVVTRAPASRQIRAAARSSGPPRLRRNPDCAQAERWSPKGSKSATASTRACRQWQGQAESPEEQEAEVLRRICGLGPVRGGGEDSAGIRPALGFEEGLAGWRPCLLEFCPQGLVQ